MLQLYVMPILRGKEEVIREMYRHKEQTLMSTKHLDLFGMMGIHSFNVWIQKLASQSYMLVVMDTQWPLQEVFGKFAEAVQKGNPQALHMQKYFMEIYGVDFTKPKDVPKTEILSMVDVPGLEKEPTGDLMFFFPLKKDKLEEFRALDKKTDIRKFLDVLRASHKTHGERWVQVGPNKQPYAIFYHRCKKAEMNKHAEIWEGMQNNAGWIELRNAMHPLFDGAPKNLLADIEMLIPSRQKIHALV